MRDRSKGMQVLRALAGALALCLIAPLAAAGATLHQTLLAEAGYGPAPVGFARTADGTLHVAFESNISWGDSANGVAVRSISAAGHVGPLVQALNWSNSGGGGSPSGIPGLAILSGGS